MTDFESAVNPGHQRVFAGDISESIRNGKYMLVNRPGPLLIMNAAGAIPALGTAAAAQIDTIHLPGAYGNALLEFSQATAQTLFPIYTAGKGIEIGCDKVDNESVEYVPGGNRADNPLGYLAGTDPGVFLRATFEIADTSGIDQFCVGWRKQEAYQVPVSFLTTGDALYTDFAGIGFSGTAAANLVKSMTDIGNAGSTTVTSTGFAWADAGIHQLEVRIFGRKVQYLINGVRCGDTVRKNGIGTAITAQATVTPPLYTVTSGLSMIPFIFHRFDATSPSTNFLRRLEVGPLLEVGLDPNARGPQTFLP